MNKKHTYIRHCRECQEIFKPAGKFNFYCKKCLKKREQRRSLKVKQTYKLKK